MSQRPSPTSFRRKDRATVYGVKSDQPLLVFLQEGVGTSRTTAKQWLQHRQVSVNGTVQTRHDIALKAGDRVQIRHGQAAAELKHPKLKLVYEDEHLMVVEKKQGLLTVPTQAGSAETTAYSILRAFVRKQNPRNGVFVVHRLDRETSGLLVFAKSSDLQHQMREHWREMVTKRTYVAVTEGVFDKKEGQVKSWFTEDKKHAMVYSSPVDDGGDLAVTNYKVLRESSQHETETGQSIRYSLVELHLQTGRTNQIRVHMTSLGHPVVGDRKYGHGNSWSPVDRLCLHARVLEFKHPVTGQTLHFQTPIPKDFLALTKTGEIDK